MKRTVFSVVLFLLALVLIVGGLSLSWRLIVELMGLLIFLVGVGLLMFAIKYLR